jgi:poly(A) polymerase
LKNYGEEVASWMQQPETSELMDVLCSAGESMFVGGCVRDSLLGKHATDIDIATVLEPFDVMDLLRANNMEALPTGIAHGTITALYGDMKYEITTLRKDVNCDGRHADVEFTDNFKEDAARRDFTYNAMFMDVEGNILDFFGGKDDLFKGITRFVGNPEQRIREDYLRILRLFRFHCLYGKKDLFQDHLAAVADLSAGLEKISGERIQHEMIRILGAEDPSEVIQQMIYTGVCNNISLPLEDAAVIKNMVVLEQGRPSSPWVRLGALLAYNNCSPYQIEVISERWRLSKDIREKLITITYPASEFDDDYESRRMLRIMGKETFKDGVMVAWSQAPDLPFDILLKIADEWNMPAIPIDGEDILCFGIPEGRAVGKILKMAVEYWEVRNYEPDREELLDYIANLITGINNLDL